MQSWLPYIGAFAFGLSGAAMTYYGGFLVLMSGQRIDFGGFLILIVIMPVLVGLVSFGVTYLAFAKQSFHWQQWIFGLGFVAIAAGFCFALLTTQTLAPGLSTALLVTTLFFGGRFLTRRAASA